MYKKKEMKIKADTIRWTRFSRKSDAIFRSLGKEISIGVLSVATLLTASVQDAKAQTSAPRELSADREVETEEVSVTASRVPMAMQQTARIVSVITREQIKECPAQSVNDLLKFASGVDVRQRGAFGIQTDISINGGTHDQIVVLLNGINISSPQTGHHSVDFPINIDDIERIEILEGAASRIYGTSAFSGAINIVTKDYDRSLYPEKYSYSKDTEAGGSATLSGGSFGTFGAEASASLTKNTFYSNVSGGYSQSDGGTENSDFQKYRAFYRGGTSSSDVAIDWQLGMSGQNYGANTFYSGKYPNQYEENRRYMASVSAHTKGKVKFTPTLYWNRSTDHYQLIRDTHIGENFHLNDVYGISANAQTAWAWGISSIGAEVRNEGILSTSLGRPLEEDLYVKIPGHDGHYTNKENRTNICYFLEHDVVLKQWTVSLGLMANMNTGLDYRYRLYPGIDVSYRPSDHWKLYASWNMAQRMPTFTDLFYKSPTQEGNQGLKPEKTSEFTVGGNYRSKTLNAGIRLFHRHCSSMIDWVMYPSDVENGFTTYHAANFKMDNMGFDVNAVLNLKQVFGQHSVLKSLSADYAYIHQKRHDDIEIYASSYAMDYLRHKLVIKLDARIWNRLSGSISYRWQDRMGTYVRYTPYINAEGKTDYSAQTVGYRPYGLLDMKLQWNASKYDLYVECNNLTSYRYYDIGNILQPGFWMMAGAKVKF